MWILGVRKLILATASVLVIGIGGTAMSHAADLGKTAPNPSWNTPASSGPSQHPQAAAALSKDDIREAQLELLSAAEDRFYLFSLAVSGWLANGRGSD